MNIVGLDIGYSNLKLAYGNSEKGMQTAIRPAGAAPADRFGSRFDGKEQDDFLHVLVGDEPFIAGVSSDRAEMWERSLHSEYARTPSYTALFHAGLLLSGMTEVDVLVTGLPVEQRMVPSVAAAPLSVSAPSPPSSRLALLSPVSESVRSEPITFSMLE